MANGNGNDLALGGLGLGLTSENIVNAPASSLAVSPDLQVPLSAPGIYRGMYNPLAPIGRLAGSEAQPAQPTNFDMAFGDSIAVQQLKNKRIWGGEGPQYDAKNPAPFDVWHTAAVGDPPSRIRDRAQWLLQQNPHYFDNINNMLLTIGSNDPSQIGAVKDLLGILKTANPNMHVVVPGMGPGVKDSAAANEALYGAVSGAGDNFHFFHPGITWGSDGVHPANSQHMFDQANAALYAARPEEPPGPQPAPASLQPQPPSKNALAPPPPAAPVVTPSAAPPAASSAVPVARLGAASPAAAQWGDFIRGHEGLLNNVVIGGDVGHDTVGYGHLVTGDQEMPGSRNSDRARGYIRGLDDQGKEIRVPIGPISNDQANQIFKFDTTESANAWKKEIPNFDSLTPLQREALISYHYNTGRTIPGMADAIAKGDFNTASNLLRNGIATVKGQPNATLAGRRAEEAQMMLNQYVKPHSIQVAQGQAPQHYGYTSGDPVAPGSPYKVGGQVERMVPQPQPNQLGLPSSMSLPEVVASATKTAVQPLQDLAEQDRKFRAMQMWAMLGASMRGTKLTPVSYNPFEVEEAGRSPSPSYSTSMGVGGVGTNLQPYRGDQSPVQSASAARSAYPPRLRGQT